MNFPALRIATEHQRAVQLASEMGTSMGGYMGNQYGAYTPDERRAASDLVAITRSTQRRVRFEGGARTKPMKGARRVRVSPKRKRHSPTVSKSPTRTVKPRKRKHMSMESSVSRK